MRGKKHATNCHAEVATVETKLCTKAKERCPKAAPRQELGKRIPTFRAWWDTAQSARPKHPTDMATRWVPTGKERVGVTALSKVKVKQQISSQAKQKVEIYNKDTSKKVTHPNIMTPNYKKSKWSYLDIGNNETRTV